MPLTKTKSRWRHGIIEYYDPTTGEIMQRMSPCVFDLEFMGYQLPTSEDGSTGPILAIDTAGGALTLAADVANGVARAALDSTSEAQESGFYFGDERPLRLNQGLLLQIVGSIKVLPTLVAEAVWGLAGDYNAVADTVAEGIWFKADGSGAILAESDDTSNENNDVSTGVTVTAGLRKVFLIDCGVPSDIRFFINGVPVARGTTFDMSTVAALALQPYVHIAKASGAGLGTIDIERITAWQNRAA